MSKSKFIAAAVATAVLTMTGCASQGSGSTAPGNMPPNACSTVTQNSCKGQAKCKGVASPTHHKKKHRAAVTTETTSSTTTETSTEAK